MPKITIKYEHPHELTDLLGKLMQMYVVPEPICGDTPYPENYKTASKEPQSELEKGYRDSIADLINQNQELRLELTQHKEKLINTQSEVDKYRETLKQIHNFIIERGLLSDVSFEDGIKHFPLLISCIFKDNKDMRSSLRQLGVHVSGKDDSQGAINSKDNAAFIADTDSQLFTLEEAAEYLEVDMTTFCRMLADGVLKAKGFKVPLSELRKIKKSWESSV